MIQNLILAICLSEFRKDLEIAKMFPNHISPSPNSLTYLIYWLNGRREKRANS